MRLKIAVNKSLDIYVTENLHEPLRCNPVTLRIIHCSYLATLFTVTYVIVDRVEAYQRLPLMSSCNVPYVTYVRPRQQTGSDCDTSSSGQFS